MALPKYVAERNGIYQFVRRVPKDVKAELGFQFWRESLGTDSLLEAEKQARARADETDSIIDAVRDGTYRQHDDDDLWDLAMGWHQWYKEVTVYTLPKAVFGSTHPDALVDLGEPIGDEEVSPIIRSREELAGHVERYLEAQSVTMRRPSPDWEKLLDLCQDNYHWGNPEITKSEFFQALQAVEVVRPEARLSAVFDKFTTERTREDAEKPITESSLKDYGTAIERFIDFFGDLEVERITRANAEQFRDLLRRLPSRPPNVVRELSVKEQADWADEHDHKRLTRETVAKLMTGMHSVIGFTFKHTAVVLDRSGWENPFAGFAGTGQRTSSAKRLPFQPEQFPEIFDPEKFRPRKPSHFWVPLILCFTGARRDEIAQLHLNDVKLDAEVPYLKITDEIEPGIDLLVRPEARKRLKTWSSARVAPIHPILLEVGLAELVAWAKSVGDLHLFPDLPHEKGNDRSNKLSTSFTKHLRNKVGLTDARYVLHSFRHTFEMMAIKSSVSDDRRKLALGRYVGDDVSLSNYAIHFRDDVAAIKSQVHDMISFPEVDATGLMNNHRRTLNYLSKKSPR